MAKTKSKRSGAVDRAAEAVGHALGSVAGTIDSLQAEHPHPVDEARAALASGQKTLVRAASKARTRTAGIIKKATAVANRKKKKKAATKAPRKSNPAVARVKRAARTVVKRAKKVVGRGRKAVRRAAGRLKR